MNEFPDGTVELADSMSRKKFLSLMGASMAMAGLVGCRKPVQKILPYVNAPEDVIPGIPNYYATTMTMGLNAYGAIIESHEGRPTHVEGNKNHPQSKGSVNSFMQASILDLYDPDRMKEPKLNSNTTTYSKVTAAFKNIDKDSDSMGVISGSINSPTTIDIYNKAKKKFSNATWSVFDLDSKENQLSGLKFSTGKNILPTFQLDKAKVILSIESDILGQDSDSIHNQKTFSKSRSVKSTKDTTEYIWESSGGTSFFISESENTQPSRGTIVEIWLAFCAVVVLSRSIVLPSPEAECVVRPARCVV